MLVIGHLPKSQEGKAAGLVGPPRGGFRPFHVEVITEFICRGGGGREGDSTLLTLEHTKGNYAPLQSEIPLSKQKTGWWRQAADREEAAEGFETYQQGREHTTQEDTHDDIRHSELKQAFDALLNATTRWRFVTGLSLAIITKKAKKASHSYQRPTTSSVTKRCRFSMTATAD